MKRQKAREYAFYLIYEADFKNWEEVSQMIETAFNEYIDAEENDIQTDYIKETVLEVKNNLEAIDNIIIPHLKNWNYSRLPRVTKAILRLAVYEIKYNDQIPVNVAINEAVEIAKKYDDIKNASFINGVLSSVLKAEQ
ncbi:MAG: transcription antitermination factor NusB [Clostridia bacterium]|nr:transcription antitermination factor NusB [Clostridia bacterium]